MMNRPCSSECYKSFPDNFLFIVLELNSHTAPNKPIELTKTPLFTQYIFRQCIGIVRPAQSTDKEV